MTYLTFHAFFILPPILLLAWIVHRLPDVKARDMRIIGLLCLIALVYTTPWDNYLVYRGVWDYGTDRVWATIGFVPIEEYLFFVLQPLLTGLWLLAILHRYPPSDRLGSARWIRRAGATGGLVATASGAACLTTEQTLYLGLILAWSGPVIAGQWYRSGERFCTRACVVGITIPTGYLWAADRFAIEQGIWSISDRYTTGWEPLGLPVEEAVFFLVTNVLVVQGILMLRPLLESDRIHPVPVEKTGRPAS